MFRATLSDSIPAGTYEARCRGIEPANNERGGFRKWQFTLSTASEEREMTAVSSEASGYRSKAYRWATAILGRQPRPDQDERLDGLPCRVHVIVTEDGFNRIDEVLPVKQPGSVNLERLDGQVFGHQAEQTEPPF